MKKYIIILFILICKEQLFAANLFGKVVLFPYNYYIESDSIKIKISGLRYNDSVSAVFLDSVLIFDFKNIPKGNYNIAISFKENSFESYLITDIEVYNEISLYPIMIHPTLFFKTYTNRYKINLDSLPNTKEYYKTGEIHGEGKILKKTIRYSENTNKDIFEKRGKWIYYYSTGEKEGISYYNLHNKEKFFYYYKNGRTKIRGKKNNSIEKYQYFSEDGHLFIELEHQKKDCLIKKIKNKYLKNYMENITCFSTIISPNSFYSMIYKSF